MKTRAYVSALWILSAIPSSHAQTPPLGRLFFTPEQRQLLEQSEPQQQRLAGVTFNGIARNQQSGQQTVWLNGQSQYGPNTPPLRDGHGHALRVGETLIKQQRHSPIPPGAVQQP